MPADPPRIGSSAAENAFPLQPKVNSSKQNVEMFFMVSYLENKYGRPVPKLRVPIGRFLSR